MLSRYRSDGADCAPKWWTVFFLLFVFFCTSLFKGSSWVMHCCCVLWVFAVGQKSLYHLHVSSHWVCLSGTRGRQLFCEQKMYFWIFIWTEKGDWLVCFLLIHKRFHCWDYCLLLQCIIYPFNLKYFAILGLEPWLWLHTPTAGLLLLTWSKNKVWSLLFDPCSCLFSWIYRIYILSY